MAMTLKALRVNKGLDQRTAAKAFGVTPETLSSWERGKSFPTVPQITLIEQFYETSYADINFLPQKIGKTDVESEKIKEVTA